MRHWGPGASTSEDPMLIIRVITFELNQLIYDHATSTSRTNGYTDGQLTEVTVAIPCLAIRASRGEKIDE